MENTNETKPKTEETNVTVTFINPGNNTVGICAFIFSIISLFLFTIVFMPIALILAIIALIKKQYAWGVCALIVCIIAACISPTIWFLIGLWSLVAGG